MAESAILKAAYSFRMHYYDYLKMDGSWMTDGSHTVDAELSPRDMRWGTTFRHQHEESLLLKPTVPDAALQGLTQHQEGIGAVPDGHPLF